MATITGAGVTVLFNREVVPQLLPKFKVGAATAEAWVVGGGAHPHVSSELRVGGRARLQADAPAASNPGVAEALANLNDIGRRAGVGSVQVLHNGDEPWVRVYSTGEQFSTQSAGSPLSQAPQGVRDVIAAAERAVEAMPQGFAQRQMFRHMLGTRD
jgi:hypothetical protein